MKLNLLDETWWNSLNWHWRRYFEHLDEVKNFMSLNKPNSPDYVLKLCECINSITSLSVKYDMIDLSGLKYLTNLKELSINTVNISSLEDIKYLINLELLSIPRGQVVSLKPLRNLTKLKRIYCYSNNITSLEGIELCQDLQVLNCAHNNISSLSEIRTLYNLIELSCFNNQINNLSGVEYLIKLKKLRAHNNRIKVCSVRPFINILNLDILELDTNTIIEFKSLLKK